MMDILGFQQVARAAAQNNSSHRLLERLHAALASARTHLEEDASSYGSDSRRYELKAFTDNIVIGWPIHHDGESELGNLASELAWFQLEMVLSGFFIRGAIAVGDVFVDEIAVFGDALLEAYDGEATLARDPRIILTNSAMDLTRQHLSYYPDATDAPQRDILLQDADGQWFVNYLDVILYAAPERVPFYDELLKHKQVVSGKLGEFGKFPPIFAKYAWVANYHNWWCDQYPHYFNDEHKIPVDLFRAPLSRIA